MNTAGTGGVALGPVPGVNTSYVYDIEGYG